MEKQVEYGRKKTDERSGRLKAWKGLSLRPNFLLVGIIFLMTLLVAKIFISGLYLHFKALNLPVMNIAMAEEGITGQGGAVQTDIDFNTKMSNLIRKEQELKEREAALEKKEQALAPLQAEVEAKIEELNELQSELTAMAKDIAEREQALKDEKINHLVTLYSSMDASKAAKIMDKLNMDTVVRILANMRGKSAGEILAAMNAEKGAIISEKLSKLE